MRCEECTAHAADYLAGTLPDETMEAIRLHIVSCTSCQGELAALDHTWQMLGIITAPAPDSTAMRARFDAVLDGYAAATERRSTVTQFGGMVARWWNGRPLLQLAGAAAALVIGVAVGRQSAPAPAPVRGEVQIEALRQEVADMREMVSMSLMQQQSATGRLEGVAWTGRIERPGNEVLAALLDALMHDPNINVRLASIDALKRFADRADVRRNAIEALPREMSPLVQVALIDFVAESAGTESADALRLLSTDTMVDAAVRTRAARALAQMEAAS